ncbi:MAG TPA: hydrogenase iron-sulfur subunit [Clostridia bacterium]|nr:hydrogenase iron-sulfur subunit [Clostridia bacterium]
MNQAVKTRIAVFACEHSAYFALEKALSSLGGAIYDGSVHLFSVPCSGRVDVLHILKTFQSGMDGVLVLGCFKEGCNFVEGNIRAEKRVDYAKTLLQEIGINPDRVHFEFTSPALATSVVLEAVDSFIKKIGGLGPRVWDVRGKIDQSDKALGQALGIGESSTGSLPEGSGKETLEKEAPGGGIA